MEYNFGKLLRELRNDKGIGQEELGKVVNVANNTISSWERGNSEPNIAQLRKIAKYFDVSGDLILGFEK